MTSKFLDLLAVPEVLDKILHSWTPASVYRLKKICPTADHAVDGHIRREFNINVHLRHFFDDPLDFRVLQARTGAIVGGSDALQFFDRTRYEGSDLDLYVAGHESTFQVCKWLEANGYELVPRRHQTGFLNIDPETGKKSVTKKLIYRSCNFPVVDGTIDHTVSDWGTDGHPLPYRRAVLDFWRQEDESIEKRKVQVICASHSPVGEILSYHSTVVMNFYTHAAAYSLYPLGTFERRVAVICDIRDFNELRKAARQKYMDRGWTILGDDMSLYHHLSLLDQADGEARCEFLEGKRVVGDRSTWVIQFPDVREVLQAAFPDAPVPKNIVGERGVYKVPFDDDDATYRDPARLNTFSFTWNLERNNFEMCFDALHSSMLVNPTWTRRVDEACYTLCRELSPKVSWWLNEVRENVAERQVQYWAGHSARQYTILTLGRDRFLEKWISICFRKCVCTPSSTPEQAHHCPATWFICKPSNIS